MSPAVVHTLGVLNAKCIQCVQAARYRNDSPEDEAKYDEAFAAYELAHAQYLEACAMPAPEKGPKKGAEK